MIDFKKSTAATTTAVATNSDTLVGRITSANLDGPISLTWLWEVITRTQRLPDDLDPKVLFLVLRDRLRNPEREIRLHALRVLNDLIPIIDLNILNQNMAILLTELIINLSNIAPSIRKSTISVLNFFLNHTNQSNEILRTIIINTIANNNSNQLIILGLIMAIPSLIIINQINDETITFILKQLFICYKQQLLQETTINSLIKIKRKLGGNKFNQLIGKQLVKEFEKLCEQQNITQHNDNIILETEITLETGPAITMQIHEEDNSPNNNHNFGNQIDDSEEEMKVIKYNNCEDSSDCNDDIHRSPRKVRFGGEIVKMRTPESDSNQTSDDNNEINTSVIIEHPTNIKITVSEGVKGNIKTRTVNKKSYIPIMVKTKNYSNPGTPKKKSYNNRRLYKSAPELGRLHSSKIPLRMIDQTENSNEKKKTTKKITTESNQNNNNNNKSNLLEIEKPTKRVRRNSRAEDEFSPIPVHNEIEVFHNLSRSPVRSPKTSPNNKNNSEQNLLSPNPIITLPSPLSAPTSPLGTETMNYNRFQIYSNGNETVAIHHNNSVKDTTNKDNSRNNITKDNNFKWNTIIKDLISKDEVCNRFKNLEDLIKLLQQLKRETETINFSSEKLLTQLFDILFHCEQQPKLQNRTDEALVMVLTSIDQQTLNNHLKQLVQSICKLNQANSVRLSLILLERLTTPKQFFNYLKFDLNLRETILQIIIAATHTFPSSNIDIIRGIEYATESMHDERRRVRQAALETLASLAQITNNTVVLNRVTEYSKKFADSDYLLRVVRTRLSRKQLPIVDLNGNVRYSSPKEQEEFEWLCGVSTNNSSKKLAETTINNYWKHNSRHDIDMQLENNNNYEEINGNVSKPKSANNN